MLRSRPSSACTMASIPFRSLRPTPHLISSISTREYSFASGILRIRRNQYQFSVKSNKAMFWSPSEKDKKSSSFQDMLKKMQQDPNSVESKTPMNPEPAKDVPENPNVGSVGVETPSPTVNSSSPGNSETENIPKEKVEDSSSESAKEGQKEEEAVPKNEPEAEAASAKMTRLYYVAQDYWYAMVDEIKLAYKELTEPDSARGSTLKKKVHQSESFRRPKKGGDGSADGDEAKEEEEEKAYDGPSAIVLVKDSQTAWERLKSRLGESPLIKEMLKNSKKVMDAAGSTPIGQGAQKIGQSVKDKIEDAREFWETSQNPLVYYASGVIENLTAQTEEGMVVSEIKKLDPEFVKEIWAEDVRKNLAPLIIKAHLSGDTKTLKGWMREGVYSRLAAEIRSRKVDNIVYDPNILDIEESLVLTRMVEGEGALILIVYMVQQIHCVRNREGEIIDGSESDVRAKNYTLAFQLSYNDEEGVAEWKIADYAFGGDTPYY